MSRPRLSAEEIAETQQLVRQSAHEVVAELRGEADFVVRYTLGNVASAIAISEGTDTGHKFANDAVDTLAVRASDAFGVWKDLYAEGDQKALPKARRALGLASEQVTFLEAIGVVELGGLHSAERLVELVQAGDTETVAVARNMTKNVFVVDRTALFGKLYQAGDAASLDLAIAAAHAAKQYTEQTGDRHYHRSEHALYDMACAAVQNEKVNDALKLMEHMEHAPSKASLHVDLFERGRAESLQCVLDYLEQATTQHQVERLERKLAKAGYAPALESIKNRVKTRSRQLKRGLLTRRLHRSSISADISSDLDDLTALHAVGVPGADKKIDKLIRSNKTPQYYLHYLGRVGLAQSALKIVTTLYEADPSPENSINLLQVQHDNSLWSRVFNYYLRERSDAWQASAYVQNLATRLKR